jgi:hypothetical protein
MANCKDNKNPLQHNGTSQAERSLTGLRPGYVQVNEKEYADWIVFANEFAAYLKYYDETGSASGNWRPFFNSDISARLGTIAVQDIDLHRQHIKSLLDFIRKDENAGNMDAIRSHLHQLFSIVFSFSKTLDRYLLTFPDTNGGALISFKSTLANLIKTRLAPALHRLIAYYKAAVTNPPDFLRPSELSSLRILNEPVEPAEVMLAGAGLSSLWWKEPAIDWAGYVTGIAADDSVFGSTAWVDPYQRVNHAANHNLFTSIFDQYTQVYAKLIDVATADLVRTLENWNTHPSHYALFLAFLRLFRFAQKSINTITHRHLDFYYKEILRLLPRGAQADKAHLLIELSKVTEDHLLAAGQLFKAGKDSKGNEILYTLDRDTIFSKAKVVSLRSVYVGNNDGSDDHRVSTDPSSAMINNKGRIFAAPIVNSDDGAGAALTSPNKEWHPYVNKKFAEAKLTDIAMPNASIGFAIASHYLFLTEGLRNIRLRVATNNNALLTTAALDCFITTEKGWYKIISPVQVSSSNKKITGTNTACCEISFSLAGTEPPVSDYNAELHGGNFGVTVPIVRILLRNVDTSSYQYNQFRALTVDLVEVDVEVGNINAYTDSGVKQLLLSNDQGPLDASKPFQPFGGRPQKDNSLFVGSKEIFSKKNVKLRFNIEWAALPASAGLIDYDYFDTNNGQYYPNTIIKHLSGGQWKQTVADAGIFNGTNAQILFPSTPLALSHDMVRDYHEPFDVFGIKDNNAFLRISLKGSFGHDEYIRAKTVYLMEKALETSPATISSEPIEPYTPTVQAFYVSYTAYATHSLNNASASQFNNRELRFFHLYPFGEAEEHKRLSGKNCYLFPQFTHHHGGATQYHAGEFYIGIENLSAQQSINLLFQVMEGTADPLGIKPERHIHWSFLSRNEWIDFDERTISDATRQLGQSGIISFVIPAGIDLDNTLLPANLVWLRASVTESVSTVCKLISVDAQAALVSLQLTPQTAADLLVNALPPSTINKLKTPEAAVKKVNQPYSSFFGKPGESSDKFYVRVSERLRHKDRAITIWDYEHLVLEAFPQIYRAKCLNHTSLLENSHTKKMEYNEVHPGHVTLITVPDLKNRNDNNPLRPYTNQALLLQVQEFLQQRISCHVQLAVRNPQFEEIRLRFSLRLVKGFDDFTFYRKKLQQEITQFLTPWAFSGDADISFGGRMYKSVLIDFIEERHYVDFITDVQMFHRIDDETPESGDLDEIVASQARSILVSAQASRHEIIEIIASAVEEEEECKQSTLNSHDR